MASAVDASIVPAGGDLCGGRLTNERPFVVAGNPSIDRMDIPPADRDDERKGTLRDVDTPDLAALIDDPLPYLTANDASLRRLAVSACADRADEPAVAAGLVPLLADPETAVRTEAIEVLAAAGSAPVDTMIELLDDPEDRIAEAAATALGEMATGTAVPALLALAGGGRDRLVREAAVAALGAIGDPRAVPTLLDLIRSGPPQVRRRAVVAVTVFDDPSIEQALVAARSDRNPMVREVAEMIVGRATPDWAEVDLRPRRDQ
jgi:HEAT repeat protein